MQYHVEREREEKVTLYETNHTTEVQTGQEKHQKLIDHRQSYIFLINLYLIIRLIISSNKN